MKTPTITLNDGNELPIIGFGTFQVSDPAECARCVYDAIRTGYRLIDTAQAYGNEEAVGAGIAQAIEEGIVTREELFVTSKVWFRSYEAEDARASIAESLRKLGLDYLDLMLLHWPFGNIYAAWRELERAQREGLVRSIGVSNWAPSQIVDLVEFNEVTPAVNQIETHLYAQQRGLHALMAEYGIAHQAYAPLGQGRASQMFAEPAVIAAAEAHGVTPYQVALRFLMQSGVAVIPKSTHVDRMEQNLGSLSFDLTEAEMAALAELDTDSPMIGTPQDADKAKMAMTW
jgi:diketogulonate reductase-like aldo/keto reductase